MKICSEVGGFLDLRFALARLSREQAARLLGVTPRTVRRWETGEIAAPRSAWLALRLLAGDLGAMDASWSGWYLRQGGLWPPGLRRSVPISAGDVAALPYLLQLQSEVLRPERPAARLVQV